MRRISVHRRGAATARAPMSTAAAMHRRHRGPIHLMCILAAEYQFDTKGQMTGLNQL